MPTPFDRRDLVRHLPRIAIGTTSFRAYGLSVVMGILQYAREHGPWEFRYERQSGVTADLLRRAGAIHGIITQRPQPATLRMIRRRKLPHVLVEAHDPAIPQVIPDDQAIGRIAFDHFRNQGFQHLAYLTNNDVTFSNNRLAGFRQSASAAGLTCRANIEDSPQSAWNRPARRRWLAGLPHPTALFVVAAELARDAVIDLHEMGILVPDDIAVLAAENDEVPCRMTFPQLSAVDINARRLGYLAAEMLDGLMHGRQPPDPVLRIPPRAVVARASTDVYATDHPHVRAALHVIRQRACDGIGVEDVLDHVPVSRRALELAFRRHLGRSVHQEIVRVRLESARRLLAETDLPLPDIAARCGYQHASNLSQIFSREVGHSPSHHRRLHRGS